MKKDDFKTTDDYLEKAINIITEHSTLEPNYSLIEYIQSFLTMQYIAYYHDFNDSKTAEEIAVFSKEKYELVLDNTIIKKYTSERDKITKKIVSIADRKFLGEKLIQNPDSYSCGNIAGRVIFDENTKFYWDLTYDFISDEFKAEFYIDTLHDLNNKQHFITRTANKDPITALEWGYKEIKDKWIEFQNEKSIINQDYILKNNLKNSINKDD